jgi:hypothetical protein
MSAALGLLWDSISSVWCDEMPSSSDAGLNDFAALGLSTFCAQKFCSRVQSAQEQSVPRERDIHGPA